MIQKWKLQSWNYIKMVKSPKLLKQIQIPTLHQPRGISIIITIHSILLLNHCEKEIKSKKWGGAGRGAGGGGVCLPSPTHSKKSSGFHSELLVSIFIEFWLITFNWPFEDCTSLVSTFSLRPCYLLFSVWLYDLFFLLCSEWWVIHLTSSSTVWWKARNWWRGIKTNVMINEIGEFIAEFFSYLHINE